MLLVVQSIVFRLFTAYTGLSLQHYIKWLRLKRAAHQLIVDKDNTIISVALNAGFESHESFTRAFKQSCGENPCDFRLRANLHVWAKPPYSFPVEHEEIMNVTIKSMPTRRLAVVGHRGDPKRVAESVNKVDIMGQQPTYEVNP